MIYNVKWWDYTGIPFNINGRVCLLFSILWGLLAVYFVSYFNPKIERLLEKINKRFLKIATIVIAIFMVINFFVTSFALQVFFTRTVNEYNLEMKDSSQILTQYDQWRENDIFRYVTDTFFSNETMLKAFPNLRITLKDNTVIYIRELYPNIQPYYFKVFDVPLKLAIDNIIS